MAKAVFEPGLIGLRDIVLVEPVSYLPATLGWAVLGALVAVATAGLIRDRWRRWRADAYRRRALDELAALEVQLRDPLRRAGALVGLAPLVKRTVLAFAPRERVAALSGEDWLRFLDDLGGRKSFVDGPGRRLEEAAFCSPERLDQFPDEETVALFGAVESWVREHRRSLPASAEA